ncbi:hypothetical protein [Moorena sp. SIO3I6]|uniref:hypothetical protein n=1 Tax=Moorena sp. SIO3I6 TaxID=2607831 RepID=UPI0013F7CD44|nr:hypothetical protein [Moorena sp. SIO3I6]NEP25877.1 hypothetical protein [Moorena sp. SIO3I6]
MQCYSKRSSCNLWFSDYQNLVGIFCVRVAALLEHRVAALLEHRISSPSTVTRIILDQPQIFDISPG